MQREDTVFYCADGLECADWIDFLPPLCV